MFRVNNEFILCYNGTLAVLVGNFDAELTTTQNSAFM